ncbi:MAG: adenosine-specific kinase [Thermoplasmata archaeon]
MPNIYTVEIKKDNENDNVIIGQSHFIKTVEDVYEALKSSCLGIEFGFAFNEASGKRLVRYEGNNDTLIKYAVENAMNIGAGHIFVLIIRNCYPINIMNALKNIGEVTCIYAASSNDMKIVVFSENDSRAVIGVMDGKSPTGIETDNDKRERKEFLRKIGYKL